MSEPPVFREFSSASERIESGKAASLLRAVAAAVREQIVAEHKIEFSPGQACYLADWLDEAAVVADEVGGDRYAVTFALACLAGGSR